MDISNINIEEKRKNFSKNLKITREQSGLSKRKVAELLGINHSAYNRYEYGTSTPTFDNLIALTKIFDITLEELTNE